MADTRENDSPSESALPFVPEDWPQQASTKLVSVIDSLRAGTTGPAIRISRAIVYGLVALILLLLAVPLLIIGLTRLLIGSLDSGFLWFLPGLEHDKAVWVAYLGLGTLFCAIGLLLWSRRPRRAAQPAPAA
jgi:hypothetical protein